MNTSPPTRPEVVVRVPPGSVRALGIGIMAALLPWLTVLTLGVITMLTQADNPWLVEISLSDQLAALTRVWAGIYAVPLSVQAVAQPFTVGLAPWGLTLAVTWLFQRLLARWVRGYAPWVALPGYLITLLALGVGVPNLGVGRLLLGGLCVGLAGVVWSLVTIKRRERLAVAGDSGEAHHPRPRMTSAGEADREALLLGIDEGQWSIPFGRTVVRVPGWLGQGVGLGVRVLVGLGLSGVALVVLAGIVSFERIDGVRELLPLDGWGTLILLLGHLAYLPTLAVWAFAWVLGVGFTLGEGTHFSAFGAQSGPVPAIPAFVAAPEVAVGWWAVGVVVLLALVVGGWLGLAYQRFRVRAHCLQVVTVALTTVVGLAAVFWASSGSLGSARLAHVGVNWLLTWGIAVAAIVLPGAVVAILAHPDVRSGIWWGLSRAGAVIRRGVNRLLGRHSPAGEDVPADAPTDEPALPEAEADPASDSVPLADADPRVRPLRPARIAHVTRETAGPVERTRLRAGQPARGADEIETTPITFVDDDETR